MKRAGVIGLGNMGSGLARNLIKAGFPTTGFDLDAGRMMAFHAMGGIPAESVGDVAKASDAIFVMVMTADQARDVILGDDGIVQRMEPGGTVILTATIGPLDARQIGEAMDGSGVDLIDSPVSGGFPGAQSGTLTLMAAGPDAALDRAEPFMTAVSKTIHRVGQRPGHGQTIKACLQSLMGSVFSATYEAAALAAKAGVSGEVLHRVFSTSGAGCGIVDESLENIIDRRFEGTGSHIDTMHKDLTISLEFAGELGVPLHVASTALQVFRAGRSRFPTGDNQVCTRVVEEIIGAELHR
ncbi:MAG: NAD(P)-dependent oxidoreductase [Paracoccaceae bacterium]|nr:NAD(P)-dependent oxidoreductase [Paracoccaceae bacterium]